MVCALIKFISTLATLASFINGASDTGKYFELSEEISLVKTMVFPVVIYGCEKWGINKLSSEEWMLSNCGVGEDSWESLGLHKEIKPVNNKGNQS